MAHRVLRRDTKVIIYLILISGLGVMAGSVCYGEKIEHLFSVFL